METGDYDSAIASFNKTTELYENSVMYDDKSGLRNDTLVLLVKSTFSVMILILLRISLKNVYLLKMTVC